MIKNRTKAKVEKIREEGSRSGMVSPVTDLNVGFKLHKVLGLVGHELEVLPGGL